MRKRFLLLLFIYINAHPLFAAKFHIDSLPQIHIKRTNTTLAIDGTLSESAWDQAIPMNEFVQRIPDNGEPATRKTEISLLYNSHYIYIGIRCFDDPEKILSREMARNADL